MKLVKNNLYLLLIDEEAEILCIEKEILLSKDESLLCEIAEINHRQHFRGINISNNVEVSISYHQVGDYYKVIAYYPLTKEAKELDLPLLPNPFEETDVEKLSEKANGYAYYGKPLGEKYLAFKEGFIEGYKTAQSKQFSLEDIERIIDSGEYELRTDTNGNIILDKKSFIQSLSTQQLPKEFFLGEGETIEEQIKNGYYVY